MSGSRALEAARPAEGRTSESVVRVRYAETDRMGVAWHGAWLAWFEVGRTDWIRSSGPDEGRSYRLLEEAGFLLPVVELGTRYHSPARYDDEIVIRTALSVATRVRLSFDYEARRRGEEALLATGRTVHAVTGPGGRPRRMPAELLAWLLGEGARPRSLA